jgi:AbiEi antitoxin C-terminal domain
MSPVSRDPSRDRRVPTWASPIVARLAHDSPSVVTRSDIAGYLGEIGSVRGVDVTIRGLVRLGWLVSSHVHGVWLFAPPGESIGADPYLDLRAWHAKDPGAVYALAGEAAAWHLGYLQRRHHGPIALWVADGIRPPYGIRPLVSMVRLGWGRDAAKKIGPRRDLLRRRRLDLTSWSSGLPAFGPEALLVQLAARPASFGPWADLAARLGDFVADCATAQLADLLEDQSRSAWQRAAYILHVGGASKTSRELFQNRPHSRLAHVRLGIGYAGTHSAEFGVTDHLLASLLAQVGKA